MLINRSRLRISLLAGLLLLLTLRSVNAADPERLLDTSLWEKYRTSVSRPALSIKQDDLVRARQNISRHDWARRFADKLEKTATRHADLITSDYLVRMIPEVTPLGTLFTPCPACHHLKKAAHPHGSWAWDPEQAETVACKVCRTVFPNESYPENVVLRSTWNPRQTFTYCGGETISMFRWKHARPSLTGYIRARKVEYMVRAAADLAEAYALTGNPLFADSCRRILLRFSDVYPRYLVHVGYGEIADMDPRVAAFAVMKLPVPELTYPPNIPDGRLHTGYWTAGRFGGLGLDGTIVRQLAQAYDLTCEAHGSDSNSPLWADAERRKVEHDLLLESTILAVADTRLNNKSVANRSAAGLVGLCVGHPDLARFAYEGFRQATEDWFLPDGSTSESPAYGLMTLSGIRDLALAFRGYTEPSDYHTSGASRLAGFDPFRDSPLPRIYDAFYNTLQGNLRFPPFADSHVTTAFPQIDAQLLATLRPDQPRYLTLLRELGGDDAKKMDVRTALYYREPDQESRSAPPLTFPDVCLPDLRIGYMRSGQDGRESLLLLNASHWGIHHHIDSLNLYYWKNGHELLSDLGYLWDHPDEENTFRTLAHNLVIIDAKEQATRDRGGEVLFFETSDRVKAMRASSRAYPDAGLYQRTAVLIDHGDGQSYAADFFDVEGGNAQDYVYHGPVPSMSVSGLKSVPASAPVYDLTDCRSAPGERVWSAQWNLGRDMAFTVWNAGQAGEEVIWGGGWGQRSPRNVDRGTTIPYIVRRCEGEGLKCFASVMEGAPPGEEFVKSVRRLESLPPGVTALAVTTRTGNDYIVSDGRTMPSGDKTTTVIPTADGPIELNAPVTVVSFRDGKPDWRSAFGTLAGK